MDLNAAKRAERKNDGFGKSDTWWTSGYWTPGLIALLSAILLILAYNHREGNFHKLKKHYMPEAPPLATPISPGPGGQAPLRISRQQTSGGSSPEFLSATVLPGRGFSVLQIIASIPGHGEMDLLHSPSGDDVEKVLTGKGEDADGAHTSTIGGAFMAPWAGRLFSTPSPDGRIHADWGGKSFLFPADPTAGPNRSTLGLLLGKTDGSISTKLIHDGAEAHAEYPASNYKAYPWPSSFTTSYDVQLQGDNLLLTLTVKNAGNTPMPVGLGWHPLFNLPSGHPENFRLTLPASMKLATGKDGIPTGAEVAVDPATEDFTSATGTGLGRQSLNVHYVHLQRATTAEGPMIVFRDMNAGYGLRIVMLDGDDDEVHLKTSPSQSWFSLSMGTNRDDPFGPEWKDDSNGMKILRPGESFSWKVRLEIFSVDE